MTVLEVRYVGLAFSDHHGLIVKIKVPESQSRFLCPKSKPQFQAKPEVVRGKIFNERLKQKFSVWSEIRQAGLNLFQADTMLLSNLSETLILSQMILFI